MRPRAHLVPCPMHPRKSLFAELSTRPWWALGLQSRQARISSHLKMLLLNPHPQSHLLPIRLCFFDDRGKHLLLQEMSCCGSAKPRIPNSQQ